MKRIFNNIFRIIEYKLNKRWLNPLATLWINLRCVDFRKALRFPILVYGRPRLYDLSGNICFDCEVKCGIVKINSNHMAAPSYQGYDSEFIIRGRILFHGRSQIDTGVKLFVGDGAILEMGEMTKICDMVNVGCYKQIKIGRMSWITHRCQLMDTNYHFVADVQSGVIPNTIRPIRIGDYVWVGNSSTISAGSVVPDNTIVASHSLINKEFNTPPYSIIGGIPAKLIKQGFRKIESIPYTRFLYDYYEKNDKLFEIPDNLEERVFIEED